MRLYETAFLIAPNLPDEELEKLIKDMAKIVSDKKGTMEKSDNWGKRRLAYPINKFEEAYYVFFEYKGESVIPDELERRFKQTESIIRYLTLKKDERENIRKKKTIKAQKQVEKTPKVEHEEAKKEEPVKVAPVEKTVEEEKS